MTLLKPQLSLSRLAVFHKGKPAYDERYHKGVNIIRGVNGSGKSTITDFIFFILGGDLRSWKSPADICSYVIAEVLINNVPVTLRRDISTNAKQPMHIFWGNYEEATASAVKGWQIYPYARTEKTESFSEVLFRALEMPDVKADGVASITMHQILRLIYVDQATPFDLLLRREDFDSGLMRGAISDVLLGIYDDSLFADEIALKSKQKSLDAASKQLDAILDVMSEAGHATNMESLVKESQEIERKLLGIVETVKKLETDSKKPSDGSALKDLNSQRLIVNELRQKLVNTENEAAKAELEIVDSKQFIVSLEKRLEGLENSALTKEYLDEVALTCCPECLSPIQTASTEGVCLLCRQPLKEDTSRSKALRMKQELALQIKESRALLEDKIKHLAETRGSLPLLVEKTRQAQARLTELSETVKTGRDQKIDQLLIQKGNLEGRLEFLHNQAKAVSVLTRLKAEKTKLTSDIQDLAIRINGKRDKQQSNLIKASNTIESYALQLLRKDVPTEEGFENAKTIQIDFSKNTFAVDGKNQFSASSVAYLKNCIHFAIFFASLEHDFMRYPRFILCDNMEDKGMQASRSQNFQRCIVEQAKAFQVEHQIIFSTSMIDPALNNTDMCVGRDYTKAEKSLVVS